MHIWGRDPPFGRTGIKVRVTKCSKYHELRAYRLRGSRPVAVPWAIPGGSIVPTVGASAKRWRYFAFRRYFNLVALKIVRKGFFAQKHTVFSLFL